MEPALGSNAGIYHEPVSQDSFLVEFKKVAQSVAQRLKEQPVIVAHSENTFDGSGIRRLLANKFELDKVSAFASYTMFLLFKLLLQFQRHSYFLFDNFGV